MNTSNTNNIAKQQSLSLTSFRQIQQQVLELYIFFKNPEKNCLFKTLSDMGISFTLDALTSVLNIQLNSHGFNTPSKPRNQITEISAYSLIQLNENDPDEKFIELGIHSPEEINLCKKLTSILPINMLVFFHTLLLTNIGTATDPSIKQQPAKPDRSQGNGQDLILKQDFAWWIDILLMAACSEIRNASRQRAHALLPLLEITSPIQLPTEAFGFQQVLKEIISPKEYQKFNSDLVDNIKQHAKGPLAFLVDSLLIQDSKLLDIEGIITLLESLSLDKDQTKKVKDYADYVNHQIIFFHMRRQMFELALQEAHLHVLLTNQHIIEAVSQTTRYMAELNKLLALKPIFLYLRQKYRSTMMDAHFSVLMPQLQTLDSTAITETLQTDLKLMSKKLHKVYMTLSGVALEHQLTASKPALSTYPEEYCYRFVYERITYFSTWLKNNLRNKNASKDESPLTLVLRDLQAKKTPS